YLGLAAQFAFRTDLASHACYFGGEGVELVDHGIDGVLELENLALNVHCNFAREIAAGHSGGDLGDVTDLTGQISGHGVHGVGKIFPRTGHARHVCLTAETSFAAHLAGDSRHFGGERTQLLDHRVQRFLELQDF